MRLSDGLVLAGSAVFLLAFYWWFFWSKRDRVAEVGATGGVQEVTIVVKGGYSPDSIAVKKGLPVRIHFRREESNECTDRVVMPAFRINRELAPFATTTVEFTPAEAGEFPFSCGMGMIHGKVIVSA